MKLRPGVLGLIALLGAGILAACGVSTTATAGRNTTGARDSCSFVTRAEVARVLGQVVSPGVLATATFEGGRACVFFGPLAPAPKNPNAPMVAVAYDSVRVAVVEGSRARTWYAAYKSHVNAGPIGVLGPGNEAYYDGYAWLNVLRGAYYVRILVQAANVPPSLSAEEALFKSIVAKL